jgi:CBS domain-containing protein
MTLARFKAPVVTAEAEDTVEKSARTMRDRHIGCLVLIRRGRPAGVITDRALDHGVRRLPIVQAQWLRHQGKERHETDPRRHRWF